MVSLSRSKYYQAVNISIYIVAAAETTFVVPDFHPFSVAVKVIVSFLLDCCIVFLNCLTCLSFNLRPQIDPLVSSNFFCSDVALLIYIFVH